MKSRKNILTVIKRKGNRAAHICKVLAEQDQSQDHELRLLAELGIIGMMIQNQTKNLYRERDQS